MSIASGVKSFFTVQPKTYCRLEMGSQVKKSKMGQLIKTEINKAFSEISNNPDGRRYFIVEAKNPHRKGAIGDFYLSLVNDNSKETSCRKTGMSMVDKWYEIDPDCKMQLPEVIGKVIKSSYEDLKLQNLADMNRINEFKSKTIYAKICNKFINFLNKLIGKKPKS